MSAQKRQEGQLSSRLDQACEVVMAKGVMGALGATSARKGSAVLVNVGYSLGYDLAFE